MSSPPGGTMSKPISYDPNWQETYQPQILTAAEAVKKIRPGQRIFIGTGVGEPLQLVSALTKRAYELPDTEILHLLTFGDAPYAHRELAQYFRVNSFFIAENVRDIIQEGLGDYTPVFLSDIPRLFDSGQLPLDVALIHVSPPDENGMQFRRVGGHREKRGRKRFVGHCSGEPQYAAHSWQFVHPRLRHRRSR